MHRAGFRIEGERYNAVEQDDLSALRRSDFLLVSFTQRHRPVGRVSIVMTDRMVWSTAQDRQRTP
jgi:hypothetical protein